VILLLLRIICPYCSGVGIKPKGGGIEPSLENNSESHSAYISLSQKTTYKANLSPPKKQQLDKNHFGKTSFCVNLERKTNSNKNDE